MGRVGVAHLCLEDDAGGWNLEKPNRQWAISGYFNPFLGRLCRISDSVSFRQLLPASVLGQVSAPHLRLDGDVAGGGFREPNGTGAGFQTNRRVLIGRLMSFPAASFWGYKLIDLNTPTGIPSGDFAN